MSISEICLIHQKYLTISVSTLIAIEVLDFKFVTDPGWNILCPLPWARIILVWNSLPKIGSLIFLRNAVSLRKTFKWWLAINCYLTTKIHTCSSIKCFSDCREYILLENQKPYILLSGESSTRFKWSLPIFQNVILIVKIALSLTSKQLAVGTWAFGKKQF